MKVLEFEKKRFASKYYALTQMTEKKGKETISNVTQQEEISSQVPNVFWEFDEQRANKFLNTVSEFIKLDLEKYHELPNFGKIKKWVNNEFEQKKEGIKQILTRRK